MSSCVLENPILAACYLNEYHLDPDGDSAVNREIGYSFLWCDGDDQESINAKYAKIPPGAKPDFELHRYEEAPCTQEDCNYMNQFDCSPDDPTKMILYSTYGNDSDGDDYPDNEPAWEPYCTGPILSDVGYRLDGKASRAMRDPRPSDPDVPWSLVFSDLDQDGAADGQMQEWHESLGDKFVAMTAYTWNRDSYHSEVAREIFIDCDPLNPQVMGRRTLYRDDDLDKHGAGEGITMCISGGMLLDSDGIPVGFSKVNDDCNDSNKVLIKNCPMSFDFSSFYQNSEKVAVLIAHPEGADFGRDLSIALPNYLKYEGGDRNRVVYTVTSNKWSNGELDDAGNYSWKPIFASSGGAKQVGGRAKITVKAEAPDSGITADGVIDVYTTIGLQIIYINGVFNKIDPSEKRDDPAEGVSALTEKTKNLDFGLPSSYIGYDLAPNPSDWGGAHDIYESILQKIKNPMRSKLQLSGQTFLSGLNIEQ